MLLISNMRKGVIFMKRKAWIIISISVIVLSVSYCAYFFKSTLLILQGAAVTRVNGNAQLSLADGTKVTLDRDMKISITNLVLPGSSLITGSGSSVDLQFTDAIKMRVGANSSLSLDVARLLREKDFKKISWNLNKGSICGVINEKLKDDSGFFIKTGASLLKVIGTEFLVEAEGGGDSKVIVRKGSVDMQGAGGAGKLVEAGNTGIISGKGVNIHKSNEKEEELVNRMSENIAVLTEGVKKQINSIIENNEAHIALYRQAVEEQKKVNSMIVEERKSADKKTVNVSREANKSIIDGLKQKNKEAVLKNKVKKD